MFSASHPGILTAGPELAKGHCPLHRWGSSGPQSGHYREVTRPDFNKSMWPRRHRHSPNRFSLRPSPPLTPLPPGWRAQGDCVGVSIAGPRMAPATPGTEATSSSGAEPSHLPQPAPPPPPSCLGGAAPGPSGPTHPGPSPGPQPLWQTVKSQQAWAAPAAHSQRRQTLPAGAPPLLLPPVAPP